MKPPKATRRWREGADSKGCRVNEAGVRTQSRVALRNFLGSLGGGVFTLVNLREEPGAGKPHAGICRDQRSRYNPVGERPNVGKARTMKLRRRFAAERRGRCLLTNPSVARGATLWAVGIERRASLVRLISGCRASQILAKAVPVAESMAETATGSSGVMTAARREGLYRNWRSPPGPGEKSPEQGRRWQQRRRPEGGRWARSSGEPSVMRRDPAESRGARRKASPSRCKGARLVDMPRTK